MLKKNPIDNFRENDRITDAINDKDFSETKVLMDFINIFVETSSESFFDDSSFTEIIKLGDLFMNLKEGQIERIRETGFLDALKHYESNKTFAEEVFSLLSFLSKKNSPFHDDAIRPHFISASSEVISSLEYSIEAKKSAMKYIGVVSSNSRNDLNLVLLSAIPSELFIVLENDPPVDIIYDLLSTINMTTKYSQGHVLYSDETNEIERFENIKQFVSFDDDNIKTEAIKLLAAIFDGCGSERCSIPDESLNELVLQILSFCIEATGELREASLELIQRYSSLYNYATVLFECDVFNAMHDAIGKGATQYKCLYIISNTMSWDESYIQAAIDCGAFGFAMESLNRGNYVDSRAGCYVLSHIFNKGTVQQIEENINDELFDKMIDFLSEDEGNIAVAILCSLERALNLEETDEKDVLHSHLVQGTYLDKIEELSQSSNSLISRHASQILKHFEKLPDD